MTEPRSNGLAPGEVQVPKTFSATLNRIVCSANRYEDGTVIVGVRHFDMLMHNVIAKLKEPLPTQRYCHEQGFIDRYGDFHSRKDAWQIAFAAGQIVRRCGGDDYDGGELYSENLY